MIMHAALHDLEFRQLLQHAVIYFTGRSKVQQLPQSQLSTQTSQQPHPFPALSSLPVNKKSANKHFLRQVVKFVHTSSSRMKLSCADVPRQAVQLLSSHPFQLARSLGQNLQ